MIFKDPLQKSKIICYVPFVTTLSRQPTAYKLLIICDCNDR